MNKRPVSYLQTDSRWKDKPYRVPGEDATVGGSGCGPSCAAMVIETLTGQTCTPLDACNWSVAHGYKALKQGTYYGYFAAQFKAFGIDCKQLLGVRLSHQPNHPIHDQVKQYLAGGYYVIALMGPKDIKNKIRGTWTAGGHFVLLWSWDNKVRINDPASTASQRTNGDPDTFRREVRNYWLIDARNYNKEDRPVTYEQWKAFMEQYRKELAAQPAGMPDLLADAKAMGLTDGSRPRDLVTREECAVMARAAALR